MKSKPKRVWTDKEVQSLAAKAYEVGRKVAHDIEPWRYRRKWALVYPTSKAGYYAMVRWLIKHL